MATFIPPRPEDIETEAAVFTPPRPEDIEPLELRGPDAAQVPPRLTLRGVDPAPAAPTTPRDDLEFELRKARTATVSPALTIPARLGAGIEQGITLADRMQLGARDLVNFQAVEPLLGIPPERGTQAWLDYYKNRDQQLESELSQIEQGQGAVARKAGQLAQGTGRAAAELPVQIVPGMGAANQAQAVARAAAAAGITGGLSTFNERRADGAGRAQAAAEGTASGLVTAVTTRAFGATGVESIFRSEGVRGIRNRLAQVFKEAGMEGAEELSDQVQQDLMERAARNPGKPIAQSLDEVLMAGAIGAILGGGVNAVGQVAAGRTPAPFTPPKPQDIVAPPSASAPATPAGKPTATVPPPAAVPGTPAAPAASPDRVRQDMADVLQQTGTLTPAAEAALRQQAGFPPAPPAAEQPVTLPADKANDQQDSDFTQQDAAELDGLQKRFNSDDGLDEQGERRFYELSRKKREFQREKKTVELMSALSAEGVVVPESFRTTPDGRRNHITHVSKDANGNIQIRVESHSKAAVSTRLITVRSGDALNHQMDDAKPGTTRIAETGSYVKQTKTSAEQPADKAAPASRGDIENLADKLNELQAALVQRQIVRAPLSPEAAAVPEQPVNAGGTPTAVAGDSGPKAPASQGVTPATAQAVGETVSKAATLNLEPRTSNLEQGKSLPAAKAQPEPQRAAPEATAGTPVGEKAVKLPKQYTPDEWDLLVENIVTDADSFYPARNTGARDYDLADAIQNFADAARVQDKPLPEFWKDYRQTPDLTATQARKIQALLKERGLLKAPAAEAPAQPVRQYPSYTTAQLRDMLAMPEVPEATKAKMRAEIAAREAGTSQPRVTPQIVPAPKTETPSVESKEQKQLTKLEAAGKGDTAQAKKLRATVAKQNARPGDASVDTRAEQPARTGEQPQPTPAPEAAQGRKKRVGRGVTGQSKFSRETEILGEDLLAWIADSGGMLSKYQARRKGPDWWRDNGSLYDDAPSGLAMPHHNKIYGGRRLPDQVAQAAYEAGKIADPNERELWAAIIRASADRKAAFVKRRANPNLAGEGVRLTENERLDNDAAEFERWEKAINAGAMEVAVDDLMVGDVLDVEGTRVEVVAKNEITGAVTLKDGRVFGVQVMESGRKFYVENIEGAEGVEGEGEPTQFAAGDALREEPGNPALWNLPDEQLQARIGELRRTRRDLSAAEQAELRDLQKEWAERNRPLTNRPGGGQLPREAEAPQDARALPDQAGQTVDTGRQQPARPARQEPADLAGALLAHIERSDAELDQAEAFAKTHNRTQYAAAAAYEFQYGQTMRTALEMVRAGESPQAIVDRLDLMLAADPPLPAWVNQDTMPVNPQIPEPGQEPRSFTLLMQARRRSGTYNAAQTIVDELNAQQGERQLTLFSAPQSRLTPDAAQATLRQAIYEKLRSLDQRDLARGHALNLRPRSVAGFARLGQSLRRQGNPAWLRAIAPDPAYAATDHGRRLQALAARRGVPLTFYTGPADAPKGIFDQGQIFAKTDDAPAEIEAAVAHELAHDAYASNPALQALARLVNPASAAAVRFRNIYNTWLARSGLPPLTPALLTEEIVADFVAGRDPWRGISTREAFTDLNQATPLARDYHAGNEAQPAIKPKTATIYAGNAVITPPGTGPPAFAITAHHGTPHKVDRFSTEKIGTGEGAQGQGWVPAQGWGLYFSEEPMDAAGYRFGMGTVKLKGRPLKPQFDAYTSEEVLKETILDTVRRLNGLDSRAVLDEVRRELREKIKKQSQHETEREQNDETENTAQPSEMLEMANALQPSDLVITGNQYTVVLNADPDHLLDWYSPLSAQSNFVGRIISETVKFSGLDLRMEAATGAEFYEKLAQSLMPDGSRFVSRGQYGDLHSAQMKASKSASKILWRAGLKGIKYGSWWKGKRNYVIFDGKDIRITHENGRELTAEEAQGQPQFAAGGEFSFNAPESVEDQKARLNAERGARSAQQAKEAMLQRADARLTGQDVDTNAELFGAEVKVDKAGQGSLFSLTPGITRHEIGRQLYEKHYAEQSHRAGDAGLRARLGGSEARAEIDRLVSESQAAGDDPARFGDILPDDQFHETELGRAVLRRAEKAGVRLAFIRNTGPTQIKGVSLGRTIMVNTGLSDPDLIALVEHEIAHEAYRRGNDALDDLGALVDVSHPVATALRNRLAALQGRPLNDEALAQEIVADFVAGRLSFPDLETAAAFTDLTDARTLASEYHGGNLLFAPGEPPGGSLPLAAEIAAAEQELRAAIRATMDPDPQPGARREAFKAKRTAAAKLRALVVKQLEAMAGTNVDAVRRPKETAGLIAQTVDLLNSMEDEIAALNARSEAVPAEYTKLRTDLRTRLNLLKGWADDATEAAAAGQRPARPVPQSPEARLRHIDITGATDGGKTGADIWDGIKTAVRWVVSPVPEIPLWGAKSERAAPLIRMVRLFSVETNRVRAEAAKKIDAVLAPLAAGRQRSSNAALAQLYKLAAKRRKLKDAGKDAEADALNDRLTRLEAELDKDPFNLFRKMVLYRDMFWRKSNLKTPDGREITLPGNLELDEVMAELQRLTALVDQHPQSAAIKESLKRHYTLVNELQQSILDHGEIIPESLKNPLYFPHHTLDYWKGKVDRVRPTTDKDFRSYLIDPVGSSKVIQADYLKAMYAHTADVLAHNAHVDLVEKYAKPYDISARLKAEHGEAWDKSWNIPGGYELFAPYTKLPLRMDYILDRETLAQKLGVIFNDGDLRERFKEAGAVLNVTPEDLRMAMVAGEKIRWVIPTEIADALNGMVKRDEAKRNPNRVGEVVMVLPRALMKFWKGTKLFAWWNWPRYEFNNLVTDVVDKLGINDPLAAKQAARAARELRASTRKDWTPSPEFAAAAREGVFETITAGEMGQLTGLPEFQAFETPGQAARRRTKDTLGWTISASKFREGVFRYSSFLANVERLRKGEAPIYGGAYRGDVEALETPVEKAAQPTLKGDEAIFGKAAEIALKTYGDYNMLGVGSQWIRAALIPFHSWTDVNFRYHANMLRNIADVLGRDQVASRQMIARYGAANAARLTWSAVRVMVGLAAFNLIMELWNNAGGAMAGLWDDDDDPEQDLSEADRRRPHLILGREKDGTVKVVYTPTAFGDILEWVGGHNLRRLMTDWLRGKRTFEEMVSEYAQQAPSDIGNKLLQGSRPDVKAIYEAASGRATFPDIFDQRSIAPSDKWWRAAETMLDRVPVEAVRKAVDKDYLGRPTGEVLQQAILQVRRRDPQQWAYYASREAAAEWKEAKTGKKFEFGSYDAPEAQALRNWRKAIYQGDVEAAVRLYERLLGYGYTAERLDASIRNQHPLSDLNKQEEREYLAQLTPERKRQLDLALVYYGKISKLDHRERQLFPRRAGVKNGVPFDSKADRLREIMEPQP